MSDWSDSVGWPSDLPFRFYTPVRKAFLATHERHCPYKADVARLEAREPAIENLAAEIVSLRAQLARWPEAVAKVREKYPLDGNVRCCLDELTRLATEKR